MIIFPDLIGSQAEILLSLILTFIFARLFTEIFVRSGEPAVVGKILTGIMIVTVNAEDAGLFYRKKKFYLSRN